MQNSVIYTSTYKKEFLVNQFNTKLEYEAPAALSAKTGVSVIDLVEEYFNEKQYG
jgi:hypothetical protein